MNKTSAQKRSAASWLVELAKGRHGEYTLSIFTALLGVACSLAPYFIIIRLITTLVNGTAELSHCLTLCAWMAGFFGGLRYMCCTAFLHVSPTMADGINKGVSVRIARNSATNFFIII